MGSEMLTISGDIPPICYTLYMTVYLVIPCQKFCINTVCIYMYGSGQPYSLPIERGLVRQMRSGPIALNNDKLVC